MWSPSGPPLKLLSPSDRRRKATYSQDASPKTKVLLQECENYIGQPDKGKESGPLDHSVHHVPCAIKSVIIDDVSASVRQIQVNNSRQVNTIR